MFFYKQQVLNALDKLIAPHQKVVDEFAKKSESTPTEVVNYMNSLDALNTYNSFKNRY